LRTKFGTQFHNRIATPKQSQKEKNLLKRNNKTNNSWQQKKPAQDTQIQFAHENQQNKQTNKPNTQFFKYSIVTTKSG
jgi:hypothetical protein